MKLKQTLTALTALGLIASGAVHADDLVGKDAGKAVFGEFDGTMGDGGEFALPLYKFYDTNADGYADKVNVSINVFPADGTVVAQYATTTKPVYTPTLPAGCTSPKLTFDTTYHRQSMGLKNDATMHMGSNRLSVGLSMKVTCANGDSAYTTGVYNAWLGTAANLPAGSVGAWLVTVKGGRLEMLSGGDMNGDGVEDIEMIGTAIPVTGGTSMRGTMVDPASGSIAMNSVYALTR